MATSPSLGVFYWNYLRSDCWLESWPVVSSRSDMENCPRTASGMGNLQCLSSYLSSAICHCEPARRAGAVGCRHSFLPGYIYNDLALAPGKRQQSLIASMFTKLAVKYKFPRRTMPIVDTVDSAQSKETTMVPLHTDQPGLLDEENWHVPALRVSWSVVKNAKSGIGSRITGDHKGGAGQDDAHNQRQLHPSKRTLVENTNDFIGRNSKDIPSDQPSQYRGRFLVGTAGVLAEGLTSVDANTVLIFHSMHQMTSTTLKKKNQDTVRGLRNIGWLDDAEKFAVSANFQLSVTQRERREY